MRRKLLFIVGLICLSGICRAQVVTVKTNILGWATTNMNAEVGMSFASQWSAHLDVMYSPWIFKENRKIQNFTATPGVRYWIREVFLKHFVGVNAIASRYHMGWNKYRYDGKAFGLGASYGYAKMLTPRLNLEFEVGVGIVYADYTKYRCEKCGDKVGDKSGVRFTPNKMAVSLMYIF